MSSTFFFGSGKVAARRVQQFLRRTSSFTGITTTVQRLLKASPSRRHDDLIGDAIAATISNTINVPTSCSERSFQTTALSFISGLFRQSLSPCLWQSSVPQVLKGAASLSALVISTTICFVNESTVASGDEKIVELCIYIYIYIYIYITFLLHLLRMGIGGQNSPDGTPPHEIRQIPSLQELHADIPIFSICYVHHTERNVLIKV